MANPNLRCSTHDVVYDSTQNCPLCAQGESNVASANQTPNQSASPSSPVAEAVQVASEVAAVAPAAAQVVSDVAAQPSVLSKVETAVGEGLQVAAAVVPVHVQPLLNLAVQLEPEFVALITQIAALFHKSAKSGAAK